MRGDGGASETSACVPSEIPHGLLVGARLEEVREPAAVADQLPAVEAAVLQEPPVGGRAANGEAENVVKEVKRAVRARKNLFEERV
eukprot:2019037-Pyramimonas_sp.AAC.1